MDKTNFQFLSASMMMDRQTQRCHISRKGNMTMVIITTSKELQHKPVTSIIITSTFLI